MKADLYNYGGFIGFEQPWLFMQQGMVKSDPARISKMIVDSAIDSDLDIMGLASMRYEGIPKGTPLDRFGYFSEGISGVDGYKTEVVEDNSVLLVSNGEGRKLYVVNSQGVVADRNGKEKHFLVVGDNQIWEEGKLIDFDKALDVSDEKGLLKIAFSPYRERCVLSEEEYSEYKDRFEGVEVNSEASQKASDLTWDFASRNDWNVVPVSNSHTLSDLGRGYIAFEENELDTSNFIGSLKDIIVKDRYQRTLSYQGLASKLSWKVPLGIYIVGMDVKRKLAGDPSQ